IRTAAWVERVGPMALPPEVSEAAREMPLAELERLRDASPLFVPWDRCSSLLDAVSALKAAGDSWGGQIRCRIEGLPAGLGEPLFDKLGALLAHGMMSLPAAVSFEAGGGEAMSHLPGSAIRDPIGPSAQGPRPLENLHGGLLGGMSTGLP